MVQAKSGACVLGLTLSFSLASAQNIDRVEELRSTGGLRAAVVGQFREPADFRLGSAGDYYVFDRLAHSVYRVRHPGSVTKIVAIGPETGRILGPRAFDLGPNGRFVVADAPRGNERVQVFEPDGKRVGGFTLPGRAVPRITLGDTVLTGVGSLQFTGRSIVMNQPELGGLITEFSLNGYPFRTLGVLRFTGHEDDRDLHLALNSGLPLVHPTGGYYFIFQAGVPVFRRYDGNGKLVFERHIQGPELDPVIAALPNNWPTKVGLAGRVLPVVPPTIRTAAIDPDGYLWIALSRPYVYVYDGNGEKVRTVSLRATGTIAPISLSFADRTRLLVTPGCYEFKVR